MTAEELVKKAYEAKEYSYSPYSHFRVGAALLCEDGRVFTGCNIENAAFTPTNCAERTALFKAVSEGALSFQAIAICSDDETNYISPCGVCRQALSEFVDADTFKVYLCKTKTDYREITFSKLMPFIFGKDSFVKD